MSRRDEFIMGGVRRKSTRRRISVASPLHSRPVGTVGGTLASVIGEARPRHDPNAPPEPINERLLPASDSPAASVDVSTACPARSHSRNAKPIYDAITGERIAIGCREAAEVLGVSESNVYYGLRTGNELKNGRRITYTPAAIAGEVK